jgi:hypothetical protein
MAIIDDGRQHSHFSRHRAERREAALLFALAFPPCLVAALARRLSARARIVQDHSRQQSVFAEAKAAAASVVPFAFR